MDQRAAVLGQVRVPEGELSRITALISQPAQQRVPLRHDAVVLAQRSAIAGRDLAEGDVQIAAALRWRAGDQADILRQEEHHAQMAHQVDPAFRHAVDAHLFAHRRPGAEPVRAQFQHQLQLLCVPSLTAVARQPGIGQRAFHRQPVDKLAFDGGARRPSRRQQVDRFQQVSFALAVGALNHCESAGQLQLQPRVVAEVGEGEVIEMHGSSGNRSVLHRQRQIRLHIEVERRRAVGEQPIMRGRADHRGVVGAEEEGRDRRRHRQPLGDGCT